jgi:hypothetical protein
MINQQLIIMMKSNVKSRIEIKIQILTHFTIFFFNVVHDTRYWCSLCPRITPSQNSLENMRRLNIFRISGAQQQEHLINPFKITTCHSQGETEWRG